MSGPLHFTPIFMERVWGGTKLESYLGQSISSEGPVGEAWLIADHPTAETVVDAGPHAGRTLRELLEEDPEPVLGRLAKLTPHGRFPLLLKILDAGAPLSVQVHPDDGCAAGLKEPDVGKTEMWHVIESESGGELVCGLDPELDGAGFRQAVERGEIEEKLARFEAVSGDSVFVSAGTVHAIGGGILLAEIQQNSDLTYRIYDYNRKGPDGSLRELHLEKAREAIHFGSTHAGRNSALELATTGVGKREVLAACRYFAAERLEVDGVFERNTRGDSFQIVLIIEGSGRVSSGGHTVTLDRGQATLLPATAGAYNFEGEATALIYYVPDLVRDIVDPLREAGHGVEAIVRLGGDPSTSDISGLAL